MTRVNVKYGFASHSNSQLKVTSKRTIFAVLFKYMLPPLYLHENRTVSVYLTSTTKPTKPNIIYFTSQKRPTTEYLLHIMKTCLYNFDPLKPHFYIVKLGFTGVYIIFLLSAQKHRLWALVRTASTWRL